MTFLSWLHSLSSCAVPLVMMITLHYLFRCYHKRHGFANVPPGPKPWPVVGNFGGFLVPSVIRKRFGSKAGPAKNAASLLTELAKVYGSVYSIYAGRQLVVILNGYKAVRDALSNHPDVFSDRPDIPAISIMTKRKGEKRSIHG